MIMTGTFRNGVIIPESPQKFAEGTVVEIVIKQQAPNLEGRPNARLVEWLRQRQPMDAEQAADWRRSMSEVLASREEDIALEEEADAARRAHGHQP